MKGLPAEVRARHPRRKWSRARQDTLIPAAYATPAQPANSLPIAAVIVVSHQRLRYFSTRSSGNPRPPRRVEKGMSITGIIPQLRTTDMPSSIRFYTEKLGFSVEFRYGDFYTGIRAGAQIFHLKLVDQ